MTLLIHNWIVFWKIYFLNYSINLKQKKNYLQCFKTHLWNVPIIYKSHVWLLTLLTAFSFVHLNPILIIQLHWALVEMTQLNMRIWKNSCKNIKQKLDSIFEYNISYLIEWTNNEITLWITRIANTSLITLKQKI